MFRCSIALALLVAAPAAAQDREMVWTAYGTTSTGYAQANAIAETLRASEGYEVSILPGSNDVARLAPLMNGRADICVCGVGAYFAFEGTGFFAAPELGPQPVRLLMMSTGSLGLGLAASASSGIKSLADLRGSRVAWVTGSDATNVNTAAFLAFAGLTWDDVKKVEFPSFKGSVDGVINGQADAAFMTTSTPHAFRLAESPKGIDWPPLPTDAEENWEALKDIAPYFFPILITRGAGIGADNPWTGAGYPYPLLLARADADTTTIEALTSAVERGYASYSAALPETAGWALERQNFTWVIPYHDGAIRHFREIGAWTDDMQAHNDRLVARSNALQAAWAAFLDSPEAKSDDFAARWHEARAAALQALENSGKGE